VDVDNYSDGVRGRLASTAALRNSIGIALITTVLALAFASMAAYAITRLDFPGKTRSSRRARRLDVPGDLDRRRPVQRVAQHRPVRHVARADPAVPVVLAAAVDLHPVGVLQEIPWDLEKAAQMDGATALQAFRRVILPLAMPGVFTAGILAFIAAWNDFLFANVLTATDASRPRRSRCRSSAARRSSPIRAGRSRPAPWS
jgi:multiple sugar transport system permease protein